MVWTLVKEESTDVIQNSELFMEGRKEKTLFRGVPNALIKLPLAEKKFGDRINLTLNEDKWILELKELNFNDTVSFTLLVSLTARDRITSRGDPLMETITISNVESKHIFVRLYFF